MSIDLLEKPVTPKETKYIHAEEFRRRICAGEHEDAFAQRYVVDNDIGDVARRRRRRRRQRSEREGKGEICLQ